MGKLTPTFADQVKGKRRGVKSVAASPMAASLEAPSGNGHAIPKAVKITAPHEPLSNGEGFATVNFTVPLGTWVGGSGGLGSVPVQNIAPIAEPAPLKIALVGTAPSSRMLAPFNDPTWQIWGCSPGNMNVLPRYDAWFEVHSNLLWPAYESYGRPYIEWLKTLKCPVYMQNNIDVPNATVFPWQDLTKEFGEDFFTSSFAWMMAYAMAKGAKEIGLFGIDMASRDEYILQRPGFYFFRHEAKKRGIKVTAPNESDIMQSPALYAISDSTPFARKILAREEEIKGRLGAMIAERDKLIHNITYLQGAMEDLDYVKAIWSGLGTQILLSEYPK